jgi:hypothetical protein
MENHIIGIIRSYYINLREIMSRYAAKFFKKTQTTCLNSYF